MSVKIDIKLVADSIYSEEDLLELVEVAKRFRPIAAKYAGAELIYNAATFEKDAWE